MSELLGVGLYSVQQAASLLGAPVRDLDRWLFGYKRKYSGKDRFHDPIWKPLVRIEKAKCLSFYDLIEARFVNHFARQNVSLQHIRLAWETAKVEFNVDFPFSSFNFLTDGRRIFQQARDQMSDSEEHLYDVAAKQSVIVPVIKPSLYGSIQFGAKGEVERWYPMSHSKRVVLNPRVGFGQPTIDHHGVPTQALAAAFAAEGSIRRVARTFEVAAEDVKAAVKFESELNNGRTT